MLEFTEQNVFIPPQNISETKTRIIDLTDERYNNVREAYDALRHKFESPPESFNSFSTLLADLNLKQAFMNAILEKQGKTQSDEVLQEDLDTITKVNPLDLDSGAGPLLPPTPAEVHAHWKNSLNPIVEKILEEVKPVGKNIKQRKAPKKLVSKLLNNSLETVGIYNHIASLMTEEELSKSWLAQLFHKVLESESKRQTHLKETLSKLGELAQKIPIEDSPLLKGKEKLPKDWKENAWSYIQSFATLEHSTPVTAQELGDNVRFDSLAQVLVALMYMGSESSKKKFLRGGFISQGKQTGKINEKQWNNFITRLIEEGILTKDHFNFIQAIHDVFEEIYPMVHQSFKEVEGWNIGHVKPLEQKYNVKGEEIVIKGGYYPLITDPRIPRAGQSLMSDSDPAKDKGFGVWYPTVDISMGRERGSGIYPLDLNLGRLFNLVGNHYSNAYMKRPLRAVDVVMRDKRVVERIESRQEGFYDNILKPWMNRVVRQEYTKRDNTAFGMAANYLRRTVYVTLFFANFRSMAKQFLGFIQAMPNMEQYVGRGRLMKHMMTTSGAGLINPKEYAAMRDEISEISPYMKNRMDNFQENLVKGLDELKTAPTKLDKAQDWSTKWSFIGIQFTQNLVDMAVWKAAMEKQQEEGRSLEEAVAFADLAVLRTQSGSQVSTLTNAQFKTPFERLAYMITMVAHGLRGQLHEVRQREKDAGKRYNLATAHALIYFTVLPVVAQRMIAYAFYSMVADEEDEEEVKQMMSVNDMAGQSLEEMLDIYNPLLSRFVAPVLTPGRGRELMGLGPVNYSLRKTKRSATASARWWNDGIPFTASDWDNLATGATILTGVPFVLAGDIIQELEKLKTEEERKAQRSERRRLFREARRRKREAQN